MTKNLRTKADRLMEGYNMEKKEQMLCLTYY